MEVPAGHYLVEVVLPLFLKPLLLISWILKFFKQWLLRNRQNLNFVPVSVNFHFTRYCNYECGFCFHTAKTSYLTPLADAKQGLAKLKAAGMKKINFSGGEPFTNPKYMGELMRFSKCELGLESVSIVSNGSLIREKFFKDFGQYLDILAISVDSFDENTNIKIGRGKGHHLEHLEKVASWCETYDVRFKLNTVVNRYNHEEDMNDAIERLQPFRWKCFQVLVVETENSNSDSSIRNATKFLIENKEYKLFCERHKRQKCMVPEDNDTMAASYLILDEHMRFLNKGSATCYKESESILSVSVETALREVDYDESKFLERGGIYDWTTTKCGSEDDKLLDW